MPLFDVIILAIVQGITEFLPVSSDGHLVLANALLEACGRPKTENLLEVELILHLGTLAAVLLFYRREIVRVLTADRKALWPLLWGMIPAGIIGVYLKKGLPETIVDPILTNPLLGGLGFLVTAAILAVGARYMRGTQDYPDLRPKQALGIGIMQAIAILPGVSRSGMTIGTGLWMGLEREAAASYSFLMSIPLIAGAGGLAVLKIVKNGGSTTPLATLTVGFIVSMIVGFGALAVLLRWLRHGRLMGFVYYLIPLGIAVTTWQLMK